MYLGGIYHGDPGGIWKYVLAVFGGHSEQGDLILWFFCVCGLSAWDPGGDDHGDAGDWIRYGFDDADRPGGGKEGPGTSENIFQGIDQGGTYRQCRYITASACISGRIYEGDDG